MGPDAAEVARRRRNRSGSVRNHQRHGGIVPCRRRAPFERKLGNDGRAMDGMASITGNADLSLACNSAGARDYRCFPSASLTAGTLFYFQAARETRCHCVGYGHGSRRAQHDRRGRTNRALFLTCRCSAISKSALGGWR